MTLATLLRDARHACLPLEPEERFDDSLSQAERKEFVEAVDWFDRQNARKNAAQNLADEI